LTSLRAVFARGIVLPGWFLVAIDNHRRACVRQSLIHRCNRSPLANAFNSEIHRQAGFASRQLQPISHSLAQEENELCSYKRVRKTKVLGKTKFQESLRLYLVSKIPDTFVLLACCGFDDRLNFAAYGSLNDLVA